LPRLCWRGASARRLSHSALNPTALTNTISIRAASPARPGARSTHGAASDLGAGRERNRWPGNPFYQQFTSKTAAGGRGKWLKSFSKSSPLLRSGGCGFPWPGLLATNAPWGTTAPQKARGKLEGTMGDEAIPVSSLQCSSFNLQWDFAGTQWED